MKKVLAVKVFKPDRRGKDDDRVQCSLPVVAVAIGEVAIDEIVVWTARIGAFTLSPLTPAEELPVVIFDWGAKLTKRVATAIFEDLPRSKYDV